MTTSGKGLELIKHFEGLSLKSYLCPAGKPSIGFGTTIYPDERSVKLGETCTLEQAEAYLRHDLRETEVCVTRLLKVPVTQEQFDAMVSLAYNIGCNNFRLSSVLKYVNNGQDWDIEDTFVLWNKITVGGKKQTSPGLTKRRKAEAYLFQHSELKYE